MHNYTPSSSTAPTTIPVVDDGDSPSAANLSAGAKANADGVAYLSAHKADYVMASGKTIQIQSGAEIEIDSGGVIQMNSGGSELVISSGAKIIHPDPQRPSSAATIHFDWASGSQIVLPSTGSPPGDCIVYDASSTVPPTNGQVVIVGMVPGLATGIWWNIKRESGAVIAKLGTENQLTVADMSTSVDWSGGVATTWPAWVELQYEGGVWRGRRFGGFIQIGTAW